MPLSGKVETMADEGAPRPETLKLFRKKYPPGLIVLAALVVLAAIAFAACMIYQATLPPDIPVPPSAH
jgi:hypothetical protein